MFRSWRADIKPRGRRRQQHGGRALSLADRGGQAGLRSPRLHAAGGERSGARDGLDVRAQGALPLRLGLGAALRHQRHLASGGDRGLGRGAARRRAGHPARARRRARAPGGGGGGDGDARRARAGDGGARGRRGAGGGRARCWRAGATRFGCEVVIDKPERWWPNGLGAQKLYTLETALAVGRRDARARGRRASGCARWRW